MASEARLRLKVIIRAASLDTLLCFSDDFFKEHTLSECVHFSDCSRVLPLRAAPLACPKCRRRFGARSGDCYLFIFYCAWDRMRESTVLVLTQIYSFNFSLLPSQEQQALK